jgi:hypothetical protein
LRGPENLDGIGPAIGRGKIEAMTGFEHGQHVGYRGTIGEPKLSQLDVFGRAKRPAIVA